MSAIALPLLKPSASAIAGEAIPSERVISYEAFDKQISRPDLSEGAIVKYFILFHIEGHLEGNPSKLEWEYATGAARDTELAKVDTALATTLV